MTTDRDQLQFHIENSANNIKNSEHFRAAIIKHSEILNDVYQRHPLFYKNIFRNKRFIICSTLLSIYFRQPDAGLKDIKAFLKGKNIISDNSLDSFLFFLRVRRWISVKQMDHDKRQLQFEPTAKALLEINSLITSMALPYQIMMPTISVEELVKRPHFTADFFSAFGECTLNDIYLIDLVPPAALFIGKDAGHMILLILFAESIRYNTNTLLLSSAEIAKFSAVSRAHINRVLLAAEQAGLLTTTNNVYIELHSTFFNMAERYFSLYFAMIGYGLEGVLQAKPVTPIIGE
ncbi:MAG: hypothetical protein LBN41_01410 [Enterobacteriaceae bacterium]|jgi:hypothetical protein|nr:hypothetical protein [Enterobacteriaceae bacterium]